MLYLKRGRNGKDRAEPVLREEERVGQRLDRPKLNMQNAPTRGKRRRIVLEDRTADALKLTVDAISFPYYFIAVASIPSSVKRTPRYCSLLRVRVWFDAVTV